ncbi:MAG: hypothetical protein MUF34_30600 [Polyangiaceae bacterium]|nr:hypothetical protein [Polyangiaceae bacterium]
MPETVAASSSRTFRLSSRRLAVFAALLAGGLIACGASGGDNDGSGGSAGVDTQGTGGGGGVGGVGGGESGEGGAGSGGEGGSAPAIAVDEEVVEDVAQLRELGGGDVAAQVLSDMLARAGFDQLDTNGAPLYPAEAPAQGIAFEQADAGLIALGVDEGVLVPLDDLLAGWGALSPDLQAVTMRPKLIADLQAAATSDDATKRYWAQLIVQLGRAALTPFDLLDPAVPGASPLDAMQVALLTYRFQAELWSEGQAAAGRLHPATASAARPADGRLQPVTASAARPADGPRPCTMTDTEQTVMDVTALASSTFFGQLIEHVGAVVPAADKLSKFGGMANSALTVVKLLWTFAAFEGHMESDTDGLVRNWDGTAYGDEATLKATFKYDVGRAQAFNCVRPALNTLGIDFSLPQDGPVANARVDWEMFDVKDRQGPGPIVRYQAGNVPLNRQTNEQGEDRITLEGTKKEPALQAPVGPDHRLVFVAAKVALKDTKLWQDIQDAVGSALAGNPVSMVLAGVAETLVRMNTLAFSARYRLPVEDHQPLDGVVMRVELNGNLSGAITPAGAGTESLDVAVSLVEKPADKDAAGLNFLFVAGQPAVATLPFAENGKRNLRYRASLQSLEPCVCVDGEEDLRTNAEWAAVRVGDDADRYVLAMMQADGNYVIQMPLGALMGKGFRKTHRSGCGEATLDETEQLSPIADLGEITITGQVDQDQPSGTIQGSLSGPLDVRVPLSLGGFYSGGVAHSTVQLAGSIDYVFGYTRSTIALPPGVPLPAAPATTLATPSEAPAPAFASWLRREEERPLACRMIPGQP